MTPLGAGCAIGKGVAERVCIAVDMKTAAIIADMPCVALHGTGGGHNDIVIEMPLRRSCRELGGTATAEADIKAHYLASGRAVGFPFAELMLLMLGGVCIGFVARAQRDRKKQYSDAAQKTFFHERHPFRKRKF